MDLFNAISGKEDAFYVAPKSFTIARFSITQGQGNFLVAFFCIVIPLGLIAAGIAVYAKRSKM